MGKATASQTLRTKSGLEEATEGSTPRSCGWKESRRRSWSTAARQGAKLSRRIRAAGVVAVEVPQHNHAAVESEGLERQARQVAGAFASAAFARLAKSSVELDGAAAHRVRVLVAPRLLEEELCDAQCRELDAKVVPSSGGAEDGVVNDALGEGIEEKLAVELHRLA